MLAETLQFSLQGAQSNTSAVKLQLARNHCEQALSHQATGLVPTTNVWRRYRVDNVTPARAALLRNTNLLSISWNGRLHHFGSDSGLGGIPSWII